MSRTNAKIIIELYGLPGSGKSTLARKIAAEYGFTHVTATSVSRLEYVTLFCTYTFTVLSWLPLILKNYFKVKSIKHFRYNISLLFVSLKKIHLAQKSKAEKVILDEGLIQRFLSYSDIVLSEKEITRLLSASPLGTMLILVNDREILKDRYDEAHDRGSLGLARLTQWRSNMVQNMSKIKGVLERRQSGTFFETKTHSINDILGHITNPSV
jgi:hypothetical protein